MRPGARLARSPTVVLSAHAHTLDVAIDGSKQQGMIAEADTGD